MPEALTLLLPLGSIDIVVRPIRRHLVRQAAASKRNDRLRMPEIAHHESNNTTLLSLHPTSRGTMQDTSRNYYSPANETIHPAFIVVALVSADFCSPCAAVRTRHSLIGGLIWKVNPILYLALFYPSAIVAYADCKLSSPANNN